jgi:cytochrome d ubiquinol oxidase subunit I
MKTADGVSPGVTGLEVLVSLIGFTLIYGVLAVVEFRILLQAIRKGPIDEVEAESANKMAVAY